jgi:Zn finger protein HypA/HybF involved in hydrogenase expression
MPDSFQKFPARINCLKCGNEFQSKDKFTNRLCSKCKRANDKERSPRRMPDHVNVDGININVDSEEPNNG